MLDWLRRKWPTKIYFPWLNSPVMESQRSHPGFQSNYTEELLKPCFARPSELLDRGDVIIRLATGTAVELRTNMVSE